MGNPSEQGSGDSPLSLEQHANDPSYPSIDELYGLYCNFMDGFRQAHGEHHAPLSQERFEETIHYYAPTTAELAPFLDMWRTGYSALTTHSDEAFQGLPSIQGISDAREYYRQHLAFTAEILGHRGEGTFPIHVDSPRVVFDRLAFYPAEITQRVVDNHQKGYAKVIEEGAAAVLKVIELYSLPLRQHLLFCLGAAEPHASELIGEDIERSPDGTTARLIAALRPLLADVKSADEIDWQTWDDRLNELQQERSDRQRPELFAK